MLYAGVDFRDDVISGCHSGDLKAGLESSGVWKYVLHVFFFNGWMCVVCCMYGCISRHIAA